MERCYDFQIGRRTVEEMRNRYEELMKIMEAEKDRLEYGVLYRTQAWEGASMEAAVSGLKEFLEEGDYYLLYEQARGMRNCMDEILSEVDYLLGVQAGFPRQFQTNRYVQPYPEVRDRNAVLNGNYASLARGEMLCEDICEEAEEAGRRLRNLLMDYGDCLGDTQEEQYEAERAVARLLRVEHYRQALWEYRTRMQALDIHMGTKLWRLTAEIVPCQEAGISGEPEESVESVKTRLLTKEGGAYVFEAYLTGEKECSPIEYEALAAILVEKLETSEEESLYVQEAYLQSLFGEGTDREKVNEFLKYVGNNGEAWDTLIRMCNVCEPRENGELYEIEVLNDRGRVTYKIQQTHTGEIEYVVPRDMLESLSAYQSDQIPLSYTQEELEQWLSTMGNEEDWQLVSNLIKGDYRNAFEADPQKLGQGAVEFLLDYNGRVFRYCDTQEQEDFLNGILYYNGAVMDYDVPAGELAQMKALYHSEQYLSIMLSDSAMKLNSYASDLDMSLEEIASQPDRFFEEHPLPLMGEEMSRMQLYHSLLNEHRKLEWLKSGEGYLELSGLSYQEDGYYEYSGVVLPKENIVALGRKSEGEVCEETYVDTRYYAYEKIKTSWEPCLAMKVIYQVLGGAFYDDCTLLGTVVELLMSATSLDTPMDIRDAIAYLDKMIRRKDISFENLIMIFVSLLAVIPAVDVAATLYKVARRSGKGAETLSDLTKLSGDLQNASRTNAGEIVETAAEGSGARKVLSNISEGPDGGDILKLAGKTEIPEADVLTGLIRRTDEAREGVRVIEGGSKTIDDIINNLPETTNGKGVARNFESTGGFDQTIKDFDSLNPIDIKEIQTQYGPGRVGKLSDGTTVVARPGSTTGGATLEIRVSNSKVYKIRY